MIFHYSSKQKREIRYTYDMISSSRYSSTLASNALFHKSSLYVVSLSRDANSGVGPLHPPGDPTPWRGWGWGIEHSNPWGLRIFLKIPLGFASCRPMKQNTIPVNESVVLSSSEIPEDFKTQNIPGWGIFCPGVWHL